MQQSSLDILPNQIIEIIQRRKNRIEIPTNEMCNFHFEFATAAAYVKTISFF